MAGEDPAIRIDGRDTKRMKKVDGQKPYFQGIAWLGALDEDGAGQWMRARPPLLDRSFDRLQRLRDLGVRCTGKLQTLQATRDHRFDTHAVSRRNPERRFHPRIVVAPVDVFGSERQVMRTPASLCN